MVKVKNNTYWKRFNGPDNFTVLWNPFDTSNGGFKLWRVCIVWNWDMNLHIVGSWSTLKLTLRLKKKKKNSRKTGSKYFHDAGKLRELWDTQLPYTPAYIVRARTETEIITYKWNLQRYLSLTELFRNTEYLYKNACTAHQALKTNKRQLKLAIII